MPPVDAPGTLTAICVGFLLLVHFAYRALERRRALIGIPTSAAAGVHIGLNRVYGHARPTTEALVAPLTQTACAAWSYRVEDEWRRDSILRWRRRRRWRMVTQRSDECDFDLVDGTGAVRVSLQGAVIVGRRTYTRMLGRSDPNFLTVAPPGDQRGATGRRRITELVVPLAAPTTVVGTARLRSDVPKPELGWDPHDRTFLVSSVGVDVHAARNIVTAAGLLLVAVAVLALIPLAIRPSDTEYWQAIRESGRWVPVLVGGALAILASYWLRYVYNDLVGLRERVERARSLIAVELQRRHDLLPALADVVRGATQHESGVMVTVAAMRTGVAIVRERDVATMTNIDRQDSEIVRDVVAIAERHPELRVGQNYQQVQASVVDAEDRLALARSFYNDSVTLYMDRRTQLPASLVAGILGFQPATLYWSGRIGEEDA